MLDVNRKVFKRRDSSQNNKTQMIQTFFDWLLFWCYKHARSTQEGEADARQDRMAAGDEIKREGDIGTICPPSSSDGKP